MRPKRYRTPWWKDGAAHCRSIDWYAEGEARTMVVGGIEVTIRFVARNGRRARIAIMAPPGAEFRGGAV